ncbi:hypothetical protein D3C85_1870980 [compost metagenome]
MHQIVPLLPRFTARRIDHACQSNEDKRILHFSFVLTGIVRTQIAIGHAEHSQR